MKRIMPLLLLLVLVGCAAEKQLLQKDTEVKTDISKEGSEANPEKQESVYVYDQIKKDRYWMNKTKDAGNPCKVAAECVGWCEPVEGSRRGECSWFPKPIGCEKRFERFEIFDVCANLTISQS